MLVLIKLIESLINSLNFVIALLILHPPFTHIFIGECVFDVFSLLLLSFFFFLFFLD